MHVRKSLVVRNPLRPVPERLPCKLTPEEERNLTKKAFALERSAEEIEAEALAEKARSKAKLAKLGDERTRVLADKRQIREEILAGETIRQVDCLLLEDVEEGALYVFRMDTGEVVQRRDMRPEEREELRQRKLPLEEAVTRTVDIPEAVERVKRFDSDPPGDEPEGADSDPSDWSRSDDRLFELLQLVEREVPFDLIEGWTDEQCQEVEAWASAVHLSASDNDVEVPQAPSFMPELATEDEAKPARRKKGEGKRSRSAGFDTRAGTH